MSAMCFLRSSGCFPCHCRRSIDARRPSDHSRNVSPLVYGSSTDHAAAGVRARRNGRSAQVHILFVRHRTTTGSAGAPRNAFVDHEEGCMGPASQTILTFRPTTQRVPVPRCDRANHQLLRSMRGTRGVPRRHRCPDCARRCALGGLGSDRCCAPRDLSGSSRDAPPSPADAGRDDRRGPGCAQYMADVGSVLGARPGCVGVHRAVHHRRVVADRRGRRPTCAPTSATRGSSRSSTHCW